MLRYALTAAALAAASCAYNSEGPLYSIYVDGKKGEYAWCMAPSGQAVAWANSRQDAMGRTYGTCTPPNRFVRVYACAPGQVDAGESPAALAARVRLSQDNSLVGDKFEGRYFCAPLPPS